MRTWWAVALPKLEGHTLIYSETCSELFQILTRSPAITTCDAPAATAAAAAKPNLGVPPH